MRLSGTAIDIECQQGQHTGARRPCDGTVLQIPSRLWLDDIIQV
jgi:hypothetical protein